MEIRKSDQTVKGGKSSRKKEKNALKIVFRNKNQISAGISC